MILNSRYISTNNLSFKYTLSSLFLFSLALLHNGNISHAFLHSLKSVRPIVIDISKTPTKINIHYKRKNLYFNRNLFLFSSSTSTSSSSKSEKDNEANSAKSSIANSTTSSSLSKDITQTIDISMDSDTLTNNEKGVESFSESSIQNDAIREAKELLEKAKLLKREAAIAEIELNEKKQSLESMKNSVADDMIDSLILLLDMDISNEGEDNQNKNERQFQQPSSSLNQEISTLNISENEAITNYLRNNLISLSQMKNMMKRIYEREQVARGNFNLNRQMQSSQTSRSTFNIGDVKNTALTYNPKEILILTTLIDSILLSQSILDAERLKRRDQKKNDLNQSSDNVKLNEISENTAINSSTTIPTNDNAKKTSTKSKDSDLYLDLITYSDTNVVMAPTLRSLIKELRRADEEALQRRLALQLNTLRSQENMPNLKLNDNNNTVMNLSPFVQNTFQTKGGNGVNFNMSDYMVDIISQPMWVPSSMLGYIISCRDEISKEDLSLFRQQIVQKSKKYYCTSWDSTSVAAIYRGNVRREATDEEAWDEINQLLESYQEDDIKLNDGEKSQSKLKDRIQLFWIDDPEWIRGEDERYPKPKPVLFVTGANVQPLQSTEENMPVKATKVLSTIASLFTVFAYGVACYALNPTFYNAIINDQDFSVLPSILPILIGVILLQFVHELAHFIVAKESKLTIGLPVPLPSLEIGTFGSITPLRSFPPTRTNLFDFALSGPTITLFISLFLTIAGILLTIQAPMNILSTLPVVPVALFKSSFLTGSLASILAPKLMTMPLSQTVPIHPLFLVGLTGLFSSALNLLPIGRLDGGRAASALFGRRTSYTLSILTLLFVSIASLSGLSRLSIFWGLIVTLFQRQPEVQVRNEVSDVEGGESWRLGIYTIVMILTSIILAPFPGGSPI